MGRHRFSLPAKRILLAAIVLTSLAHFGSATQADDTIISIGNKIAGATPFLSQVTLEVSNIAVLKTIRFTIAPKPGSFTRPLSATYSTAYLTERGDITNGTIYLPVYGLYDNYTNTVTLSYIFSDGSSKADGTTITTEAFDDPCGYEAPIVVQSRVAGSSLSYDYMLL